MRIGFYARCKRHECNLEVHDYDITMDKHPTMATKWVLLIEGWYCPADIAIAERNSAYEMYSCKDAWWLTAG